MYIHVFSNSYSNFRKTVCPRNLLALKSTFIFSHIFLKHFYLLFWNSNFEFLALKMLKLNSTRTNKSCFKALQIKKFKTILFYNRIRKDQIKKVILILMIDCQFRCVKFQRTIFLIINYFCLNKCWKDFQEKSYKLKVFVMYQKILTILYTPASG